VAERIYQACSWPGVLAVESCRGTVSHGITPGVFTLTTYPQAAAPAEFGDLVLGDGVRTVTLKDCKVDSVTGQASAAGQTWTLTILDRRWKWAGGSISGRYNQQDRRGKFVPWTIRSPEELAKLCLEAMGEKGYFLDLPDGLEKATGADEDDYLRAGENFAQTQANPPVTWDVTNPARALAILAERFGRRVVFQPLKDRVAVLPLGEGEDLPDGPLEMSAPSLDAPETPKEVAVAGAPVRIQCRLALEAVGEEWDGEYLPIDLLSYAPTKTPEVQISTATYTGSGDPTTLKITIKVNPGEPTEREERASSAAVTVAAKLADLAGILNRREDVSKLLTASATATVLTLTGKTDGRPFWSTAEATGVPAGDKWEGECVQVAVAPNQKTWGMCRPPNFNAVRTTDRLSRAEAVALAQKTAFRCYRIMNVDPAHRGNNLPVELPWFGEVQRRQQIVLQGTKVDQVRPLPRDKNGVDKGRVPHDARNNPEFAKNFGGILPSFYNGYSRDQPAQVTGSVSRRIGSVNWVAADDLNTAATDKVYVPFTIDPVEQLVIFAEPVYREFKNMGVNCQCEPAVLTLETAVLVLDADTNELVRWVGEKLDLGGRGATEWQLRDDVQVSIVGEYDDDHTLQNYEFEGLLDDARPRAKHYLDGMASRYELTGGETRQYIGIREIEPDGFVQQVSWSLGLGGATTLVSANAEHDPFVPSYPERRRRENLSPDASARAANAEEQRRIDDRLPLADERYGP
jgi:hypothetical protein